MILMPNEVEIKKASVATFTATLTNFRLCIDGVASEESYPIDGITGLAIVDDLNGYALAIKSSNKRKLSFGILGGLPSLVAITFLKDYADNPAAVVFLLIGIILLIYGFSGKKPNIESNLTIMQMGGTRTFSFLKNDRAAQNLKHLIDEINMEFILRKQISTNDFQQNTATHLVPPHTRTIAASPSKKTSPTPNPNTNHTNSQTEKISNLKELKGLLDAGILNQQEYDNEKEKILR